MYKTAGLFIGLNYINCDPKLQLQGCIKDVNNLATLLQQKTNMTSVTVITDESNPNQTTKQGIIHSITRFADYCNSTSIDLAWIHYSGHGSRRFDTNKDELDGKDECIVPWDFQQAGFLVDDEINELLRLFKRPTMRIVCVFDSCHSGTVCDVPFSWNIKNKKCTRENKNNFSIQQSKVIAISGCLDNQVSYDTLNGGIMTTNLVATLTENFAKYTADIFELVKRLQERVGKKQTILLTSSFNLMEGASLFPKSFPTSRIRIRHSRR